MVTREIDKIFAVGALNAVPLERIVEKGISSRKAADGVADVINYSLSNLMDSRRCGVKADVKRHREGGYQVAIIVPRVLADDERLRETLADHIPYFMEYAPFKKAESPIDFVDQTSRFTERHSSKGRHIVYVVPIGIYVQ